MTTLGSPPPQRRAVLRALAAACLLATACTKEPPNATPEGAVRELIERLRMHDGDPKRAKAVYELLSKQTRQNLDERAERYSAASGKHIAPEMMLAPASFIERFAGTTFETQIRGSYAVVRVRGVVEEERAEIACVYEDGGWRVHIEVPALAPVVVRPREESPPPTRR